MAYSENVIEVHEATFERDVIERSHEKPVVVDFWAAWCGPCRMLGPVLERLANEPGSNFILAKVDVDVNQNLSMQYGIQGIPAVKAFKDGQVAGEFVGALPEPRVRQFLSELAPSDGEMNKQSVEGLLSDRHWAEAEAAYAELLAEESGNNETKIGLVRALIPQGKGCEAKGILEGLLDDFFFSGKSAEAAALGRLHMLSVGVRRQRHGAHSRRSAVPASGSVAQQRKFGTCYGRSFGSASLQ